MLYRIAIITINLNNEKGLAATIASVAMQALAPNHFVVVDGGSDDGSVACIQANSHVITHWVSEKDDGVYQAQNKGWQLVDADYYLFLNSGDTLITANSLAQLAAGIKHLKQMVYGHLMIQQGDGTQWVKAYPAQLPPNYFDYETLPHPATLISKYWLQKMNGYDEQLKICSDWKFFRQVFQASPNSFAGVPTPISLFALDGISSSPAAPAIIAQEKALVKKMQPINSHTWRQKIAGIRQTLLGKK